MSEKRDFDFCPRCGALMQNGVCQSCGRGMPRPPQMTDGYYTQNPPNQTQMQQGNPGMQYGSGVSGREQARSTYMPRLQSGKTIRLPL